MFWGLIIEPNKRYTQTVEKPFHVSMATLDVSTADDDIVQVMLCYDGRNYLLCNLKKGQVFQVPLDLNFQEGTKIAFTSNGRGHVHLTGYLVPEDELDDLEELDEDEEEEEEEEEIPQLVGKRKAKNSPKDGKAVKRLKESAKEIEEDEDDDSSDDGLLDGLMPEDDSDDEDEAEDEEEEDDDEAESDDDEEEEEEEEVEEVKPQKKGKQNKSQQADQSKQDQSHSQSMSKKQKKREEKALKQAQEQQKVALVNGKDKKADKKAKDANESLQKKRVIGGGVQVEELKMGNGAPAKSGRFVTVYYVGRLPNGKKFDSSTQGEGFKFRLGKGEVIKGWDVGVQGMKVGGKRRLTIPPHMGYGAKGSPPVIPGNSPLLFDIELKQVH